VVLVVDQDQLVAGLRIGETDAAWIAGLARVGDAAHRAAGGEFVIAERE
jgi:hypothetical protein